MNIIHQITLSELNDLSNKVIDIKASLESNQKINYYIRYRNNR